MDALYAMVSGVLLAGAVFLLLSRDLFRVVLGLMILTNGANLAVVVGGRMRKAAPPYIPEHLSMVDPTAITNPLPQAFVLTAIVIGLGIFVFVLSLLLSVAERLQTLDVDDMQADGPEPAHPPTPPSRRSEPTEPSE